MFEVRGGVAEFVPDPAMVSPEEEFTETIAAYLRGGVPAWNEPIEGGGGQKLDWFRQTHPPK